MIVTLNEGEYFGHDQRSLAYDSIKLSQTIHCNNSHTKSHRHKNQYFSILLEGAYLEKNVHSEISVQPGDVLYRPEGYAHQNYFKDEQVSCFNLEFGKELIGKYEYDFKFPKRMVHFKAGATHFLVQMLVGFMDSKKIDLVEETILDFFYQIDEEPQKPRLPWLEKVVRILENEVGTFHSLDSLSKRVFVHSVYLARTFKQNIGLTVGQYQMKIKLSNALSLLMNTLKPISEISCLNGFYDDPHFINSFKSYYNISPHQFRLLIKS